MQKEFGNIKITETDEGYQIEIKGKDLKEAVSKCCCHVMACCCPPSEEKKEKQ